MFFTAPDYLMNFIHTIFSTPANAAYLENIKLNGLNEAVFGETASSVISSDSETVTLKKHESISMYLLLFHLLLLLLLLLCMLRNGINEDFAAQQMWFVLVIRCIYGGPVRGRKNAPSKSRDAVKDVREYLKTVSFKL
jgi:hypothetical protein